MHLSSADIIKSSEQMKDFDTMHIGNVHIPPPTEEELEAMRKQREVVAGLNDRSEMFIQVQKAKSVVRQTQLRISRNEGIISSTLQEVQKYRDVEDFDWSLVRNNHVRELKKVIAEEEIQLQKDKKEVSELLKRAKELYPDMEFEVKFQFS